MKHTKVFYGSSYDRGLQHLLKMWPKVLEAVPNAELHICYGWDLFDKIFNDNPERKMWKAKINKLMDQKGIVHHGRLGKKELQKVRKECGVWAYPTHFQEINCITALEAQNDGLVPVTMDFAALKETVHGGTKVDGDIYETEIQDEYVKALVAWMTDEKRWEKESQDVKGKVQNYSWDIISDEWLKHVK